MEGSAIGRVRQGSATTTHAVKAAIQRSQASIAELSRELEINAKTVARWRERQPIEDQSRAAGATLDRSQRRRGSHGGRIPPACSYATG